MPASNNTSFARSYQASYGGKQQMASVKAGTVTDSRGGTHSLKSIQVIPVNSSAPPPSGLAAARPLKKRLAGAAIAAVLLTILQREGGPMSLVKAAVLLKQELRQTGEEFEEALRKTGGRLVDLINASAELKLVGKTATSLPIYVDLV